MVNRSPVVSSIISARGFVLSILSACSFRSGNCVKKSLLMSSCVQSLMAFLLRSDQAPAQPSQNHSLPPPASHGFLGHVHRDRGLLVANHGYRCSVSPLVLHRLISRVRALAVSRELSSEVNPAIRQTSLWLGFVWLYSISPGGRRLGSFGKLRGGAKPPAKTRFFTLPHAKIKV
jgi:hypothetical protein